MARQGSDKKMKVHLEEEQETLLITLYAKALDNRRKRPVLHDRRAEEIMESIDYPFEKLDSFGDGNGMVVRARQMDAWVSEFLSIHPDAVVLNLGCGLDTRITRIDPPPGVRWFDVDYPAVIDVRRRFYADRDGYEMIASSIVEPDWLEAIPRNQPAMIVAEGVLEYLTAEEVRSLLDRLTRHFPHGRLAFDVMNAFAVQSGRESLKESTGAVHQWVVDDTREVDKMNDKLARAADLSVFRSRYIRGLSVKYRLIYGVLSRFSNFRDMIRLLVYDF